MPKQRQCPQCESFRVELLEAKSIARSSGYRCEECGLRMRSDGHFLLYFIALVLSLSVSIYFAAICWEEQKILVTLIKVVIIAIAVAGYSIYQLLLPTPRVLDSLEQAADEI
jgi:hypothetical protein